MAQEAIDILAQDIAEYTLDRTRDVPWHGIAQDNSWQDAVRDVPQQGAVLGEDTPQVAPQVTPQVTPQVASLLKALSEGELSAGELRARLGLSDAKSFRALYLRKAMDAGLVEMTVPDKPRSSRQKYRLTESGATTLAALEA